METPKRGMMLLKMMRIYNKKGDDLKRVRESIWIEYTFDFEWMKTKIIFPIKAIEMAKENTALTFYLLNLKCGKNSGWGGRI